MNETKISDDAFLKESKLFESYYKEQCIVDTSEWDEFVDCLKEELPSTFRMVSTNFCYDVVKSYIKSISETEVEIEIDDKNDKVKMIEPLRWYPDELAYQISKSRVKFRRSSGVFKDFHSRIVHLSDGGCIYRQEAVSMLPVLFLNVKQDSSILDLCSAPGSKTSQILELLEKLNTNPNQYPKGILIANDLDTRRAHMLIHHTKNLNSPNLIVTTHSADNFPDIYVNVTSGSSDPMYEKFYFDRILCDVPCSADGTLRKNPLLFKKWNLQFGLALHRLQKNILTRALHLVKPSSGLVVYSTCSFNPLENEAVVSSVIQLMKERGIEIETVDPNTLSPQVISKLKYNIGVTKWKVPIYRKTQKKRKVENNITNTSETNIDSIQEYFTDYEQVTDEFKNSIFPSMFPPKDPNIIKQLSNCIRVLPHFSNTGGFFITILRISSSKKMNQINYVYIKNMQPCQDDFIMLGSHPTSNELLTDIFGSYGLDINDNLYKQLVYRNPSGEFSKKDENNRFIKNSNKTQLIRNNNEKLKQEELDENNTKDINSIHDNNHIPGDENEEFDKYPRKFWLTTPQIHKFLFTSYSKIQLRIIHIGFIALELSRFKKRITYDVDIPLYRFNSAFCMYLYKQLGYQLNNTLRCKQISKKGALRLFQHYNIEDIEKSKDFYPFRIPRYILEKEGHDDLLCLLKNPGSIVLRLDLNEDEYPLFLPAHVGRHNVELLFDKFLRYCIKFYLENK